MNSLDLRAICTVGGQLVSTQASEQGRRSGMGQQSSRLSSLRRAIRENQADLTEVDLTGVQLPEKPLRKLAEALKRNQYVC